MSMATDVHTPPVIQPRTALHTADAPLAMLWFTCTRDLDALAISVASAVDVVPAGTTFHLVFAEGDVPDAKVLDRFHALWPACHIATTAGQRSARLKGADWVAQQFSAFAQAMRVNPEARYLAKIDSDVVLFGNGFLRALRPERWMMHGQGAQWRGYWSAWGGLYFLHRDFIQAVARHPDPVALLHEMNQRCDSRFRDFPEDQAVSQLAVHLYSKGGVWFQQPADWMTALLGRWHYTYPDDRDRDHYWFYDAVEFGLVRQIKQVHGCDQTRALAIRDQTMQRHFESSRNPRKYR